MNKEERRIVAEYWQAEGGASVCANHWNLAESIRARKCEQCKAIAAFNKLAERTHAEWEREQ